MHSQFPTVHRGRRHMNIKGPCSAPRNELNGYVWLLNPTDVYLKLYLRDSTGTSQRTQSITTRKTNLPLLFGNILAAHCDNQMKRECKEWAKCRVDVTTGGGHVTAGLWKVQLHASVILSSTSTQPTRLLTSIQHFRSDVSDSVLCVCSMSRPPHSPRVRHSV